MLEEGCVHYVYSSCLFGTEGSWFCETGIGNCLIGQLECLIMSGECSFSTVLISSLALIQL